MTFADIADSLLVGAGVVDQLLSIACWLVGAGLVMASFIQYLERRKQAKLVPFGKIVSYFILGICLILVPFFHKIFTIPI